MAIQTIPTKNNDNPSEDNRYDQKCSAVKPRQLLNQIGPWYKENSKNENIRSEKKFCGF